MRRRLLLIALLALLAAPVVAQGPLTPAAPVTGTIYDGNTPLVPQWRRIDAALSGNNQILEETTNKRICVTALHVTMTGTAVTIRFESTGDAATPLTGQMTPTQGASITWPFNPSCWLLGATSGALIMELGGAQSVDGVFQYVLVDP